MAEDMEEGKQGQINLGYLQTEWNFKLEGKMKNDVQENCGLTTPICLHSESKWPPSYAKTRDRK